MLRIVATLALALAASASFAERQFEVNTNRAGYELTLRDVIMPNGPGGTTIFKLCTSCDTIALPVQTDASYAIGGTELALPDFLAAVEELRAMEDKVGVGVFYDMGNNRVTYIAVYPPR